VDDHRGGRRAERRVHLSEAAALLGVSKDAVRMRVKRGTLRSEKGADGRVYVWVNGNPIADPHADLDDVHPGSQAEAWRALINELRDRVRSLEESNRENRRIIAALTSRIPAIEAPPDERESPETAEGEAEGAEPRPATGRAQEAAERRPWWRRMFGS
jgi:hypothetical protein